MPRVDELIASFTQRQHGLIARWQALAAGITERQLKDRVKRGLLIAVHPGVYRLRGVPFTQAMRWLAAVLAAGEGSVLSHQAAASVHFDEPRRVRPIVTTPHVRHPEIGGVTLHRTRRPIDRVVIDGIPMTTKARTTLDCAAVLPYEALESLLQHAVTSGRLQIEQLLALLDRRGGRGVQGTVAMRAALEGGLVDEKIERKLELLLAGIIDAANVPPPVRQHPLIGADGKTYFLDNAWVAERIAVEGDGRRWHGSAVDAAKTRTRARAITAVGFDLYTYGWTEAVDTPLATQREIETIVLGRIRDSGAA